jgi:hypothetical protein
MMTTNSDDATIDGQSGETEQRGPQQEHELSERDQRLIRELVQEARQREANVSAIAIAGRAAPWVDAESPEPVIEFIAGLGEPTRREERDAETPTESPDLEAFA